jgi:drug/metabolite transporter (DMT)-like permease
MADSTINRRMGATEWALLIALSVLWGGSFLFVGMAVRELPPLTIVMGRVALAAVTLHIVLTAMGGALPRDGRVWAAFFGMGVLNNAVPFTLIAWGQAHIASGLASILNATTPLFTVLVAHWLTPDERATPRKIRGVIIGFVGVAIMIGGDALRSLGVDVVAQLAVLAAAISYAFAGVYGRRFKTMGVEPMTTAAGMLTASTLMLMPVMLAVDRPWTLPFPSGAAVAALVGLALLSTSLAYIFYFRILATAGATNLLLVTFLIPVSAILLGATFLGERLEARHFLGMAMIGLGLAAIDGRALDAIHRIARPGLSSGNG